MSTLPLPTIQTRTKWSFSASVGSVPHWEDIGEGMVQSHLKSCRSILGWRSEHEEDGDENDGDEKDGDERDDQVEDIEQWLVQHFLEKCRDSDWEGGKVTS